MIINKYLAGLLSVAITILTAFVAIPAGAIDAVAITQLVAVGVAAVGTFFLPLVTGPWQSVLKTGVAVLAAVFAAVTPFIVNGGITSVQVGIVALAGLNALAVQIGSSVRIDSDAAVAAAEPVVISNSNYGSGA